MWILKTKISLCHRRHSDHRSRTSKIRLRFFVWMTENINKPKEIERRRRKKTWFWAINEQFRKKSDTKASHQTAHLTSISGYSFMQKGKGRVEWVTVVWRSEFPVAALKSFHRQNVYIIAWCLMMFDEIILIENLRIFDDYSLPPIKDCGLYFGFGAFSYL